jgi:hypothetical protein
MLAATHGLPDGSRVRLRLARPSDLTRIDAFLTGLDDARPRDFAFYDPRERLTIAAARPGEPGEEIVGLAVVEIAGGDTELVVPDDDSGAAVGELLTAVASDLAAQRRLRNAA